MYLYWPTIDWSWTVRAFLSHFAMGFLIAWLLYLVLSNFLLKHLTKLDFYQALFVGFIGAWFSVVIDIDHLVLFLGWEYSRPLHLPVLFLSCLAVSYFLLKIFRGTLAEKNLCWMIWAICAIAHVAEDFWPNWF